MRRAVERAGAGTLFLVLLAAPVAAWSQAGDQRVRSPQEEKRRRLLEGMGLKEQKVPPQPSPAEPSNADTSGTPPAGGGDTSSPQEAPGSKKGMPGTAHPTSPSFRRVIHPLLMQSCKVCHAPTGPAAGTHFLLSGDPVADHAAVSRQVNVRAPAESALLLKVSGQKVHAGGLLWVPESVPFARTLAWIQGGARLDAGGSETPTPLDATVTAARPTRAIGAGTPGAKLPPAAPTAESSAPVPASVVAAAVGGGAGAAAPTARGIDFASEVHPTLMRLCSACHAPAGPAAITRFVLVGDAATDYAKVRVLVDLVAPPQSLLLTKGSAQVLHAGGPLTPVGSPAHTLILAWVAAGALAVPSSVPSVAAGAPTCTPAAPPCVAAAPASAAPPSPTAPARGFIDLPYGFALDGRFDVTYERRAFSGNPFEDSAVNALRSYHHFLFLSRESTEDPIGLSVEILNLTFWEAHYRWTASAQPVQVVASVGKILVPFGADPLMHQSYGGLTGFDQKILPVIWAQEGAAVHGLWHRSPWSVTDDVYVVRGYTLRAADGVLNLQNDFSSADDTRLGYGNRLGGAWGPLSGWYSTYYNGLGFGRHLLMQAADIMLWRLRQIPVLGHFSFAAGLLRADVSGGDSQGTGGPGKDYYHFGSYFQLRYHPTDWLYAQYRQGVRTFDNRRGLIVDDTRLTSDDGSTHSFAVVARSGGLTGGVFYFINLEKGPEIPDDFYRVSLTYDF